MPRAIYPSDITRKQFESIRSQLESFKRTTKPRKLDVYDIFCAVLYVLKSSYQWRMLPSDYPKWGTVYSYFRQWSHKPALASNETKNTDQGAQFTTPRFTRPLLDKGIKVSMDGRGRALDNIFVERLWRTVKYEHVYLQDRHTVQETWLGLRDFFHFYNHERLHQSLDYRTPADVYLGMCYEKDETTHFYQPASICVYEILV